MPGETKEEQILRRLGVIDQYKFELMVANLLYQGAFLEIAGERTIVNQFGTNVLKQRTRKSNPRPDAEVQSEGLFIECSVQEDWAGKLIEVVTKNKGKHFSKFVFFTNQDTANKRLRINGNQVDPESYCSTELGCDYSRVIGLSELALPMRDPKFFNIRRNFLNIDEDYFCSGAGYSDILNYPMFKCATNKSELDKYAAIIDEGECREYRYLLHQMARPAP